MLPKYSALGKKKHHRHTIICIINQDLTRPLVGLAASLLSGKPARGSATRAGAGTAATGTGGLALGPSRKLFPSINCQGAAGDGALAQRRTSTGSHLSPCCGCPSRERGWSVCVTALGAAPVQMGVT